MMKRFNDYHIDPLRLDYDDEDVFLDTPTTFNLKKSSSYQYVSMTSVKDHLMKEIGHALDETHDLLGDRAGKILDEVESRFDRFSPIMSRHQNFGLHRKRSKKGTLRFR